MFKFQAVFARTQPFLSRSVEKRGDQSRFKCRKWPIIMFLTGDRIGPMISAGFAATAAHAPLLAAAACILCFAQKKRRTHSSWLFQARLFSLWAGLSKACSG
jgi:hypothetical protein